MGIYLNPGNAAFQESIEREIYVDKSLLIEKVWHHAKRINKYLCFSRPRRFGKSTDANMLAAYFSKGCDSHRLFEHLNIVGTEMYAEHLNRHHVIHLDMQKFLSIAGNIQQMKERINEKVTGELAKIFSGQLDSELSEALNEIFAEYGEKVIFIIDEWDCVLREFKEDRESQIEYLDYLRLLLKEQPYVELAYMTGILPIKKYGTHSALNMFDEISMLDAKSYSAFMGFTESEVQELCTKYDVDYEKMKEWYDGYYMRDGISTYSPRSVTAAINNRDFANYWSQTETYEALKTYIDLNYDGLKDTIIDLLAGKKVRIDTLTFQNDMYSFSSKNDVLTLLIHLGYLGYIYDRNEIYIPNNEVKDTFIASIKNADWDYITQVFNDANDLLEATWNRQEQRVAKYIENSHYETSILQYNDENALSYTVSLAYITAKRYYTIVREMPAGKGFADIVFIPRRGVTKPAMIVELKYDKEAETGIRQIKDKKYYFGLEDYLDNLLLVSIAYDKNTKEHSCVIEIFNESK